MFGELYSAPVAFATFIECRILYVIWCIIGYVWCAVDAHVRAIGLTRCPIRCVILCTHTHSMHFVSSPIFSTCTIHIRCSIRCTIRHVRCFYVQHVSSCLHVFSFGLLSSCVLNSSIVLIDRSSISLLIHCFDVLLFLITSLPFVQLHATSFKL